MQEPVLSKFNVYQSVTSKIIEAIENGPGEVRMPWHVPGIAAFPTNAVTHGEYRGVNVLSLWIDAQLRGYPSQLWASYRQWKQIGAQVRKGEKGSLVVFYKRIETSVHEEEDHERDGKLRFVARASWVFNVAQVDGFVPPPDTQRPSEFERLREVEAFVDAIDAKVEHGHPMARYRRDIDTIEMPSAEWFVGTPTSSPQEAFHGVLLHETVHWVGAEHRLNRTFGKRFGDANYAMEEMVAEIGAAFLCAAFGISNEPRPDHAAYIANWLKVLKNDPKAIFTAASQAQEAFEHLAYLATRNDKGAEA